MAVSDTAISDRLDGAGPQRIVVVASLTRSLVNFRYALLEAMVAAGHEVTAVAPDEDSEAIAALNRIGVTFRRIPMARTGTDPLADIRTLAALYRLMRGIRPDIVLTYTMKPIIYGGLAARLSGVGRRFSMFTGFGYMFGGERRGLRLAALRRLSIWLYRRALAGTEAAFVYNENDAAEIRRHALIGKRTALVSVPGSGVDLDHHAQTALPAGPFVFLLVARLLREKGIAEFAAAARLLKPQFPQTRFQILGPFDPNPAALSQAEVAQWTADSGVEYLGETTDVRPYLSASTVFVLPSYYREGIPRSALEALATGRPIITTDMPGCRETVIDGENGFRIAPRSAADLANAMRAFLDDERLAPRMAVRSRTLAMERFDVRAVNAILLESLGLRPAV
ncbi:glycosyl transferase [Aureimonas sp. SA4125]|uniref:glycosyltransferase family 4 protein n=1 Tax=Aureimonas sp. SA4125 TaxID=2826993 RepID=UPI001CC52539|nr:glycosyltransferase family 4 protein [Aureimonas sp. SA4125]BDA82966.1 glycosyl transferase [Aureimonas sp. SA4125]